MKPRLLDLFCGAGGAGMGYHRAGFDVTGVDIRPQPRYPFAFVQGDALEYIAAHGCEYDVIHASPPCQLYSAMRRVHPKAAYPDLIDPVRRLLIATDRPYVIENVELAPLLSPVMLCGTMFGLRVFRHRLFESPLLIMRLEHMPHRHFGKSQKQGRPATAERPYLCVTGNFGNRAYARAAMGIDWMVKRELSQAIPPAYTEWIGQQLMLAIQAAP